MTANKTTNPVLLFVAFFLTAAVAHADLQNSYSFNAGGDPLIDNTGSAHLLNAGGVTFGDEDGLTFASFGGTSTSYLVVDESVEAFDLGSYTLSFWFRLETTSQINWSGLLSSNYGISGGYQIGFHSGLLRFATGIFAQTVNLTTTADLGTSAWHLLTISPNGVWVDGTFQPYSSNYSLPALKKFALGSSSFKGDIADVRIYGPETQWDDAMQASAYAEGPGLPAAPNPGTVILISRLEPTPFDRIARGFLYGTAPRQSPALQQ